jgi:hypothetical protein
MKFGAQGRSNEGEGEDWDLRSVEYPAGAKTSIQRKRSATLKNCAINVNSTLGCLRVAQTVCNLSVAGGCVERDCGRGGITPPPPPTPTGGDVCISGCTGCSFMSKCRTEDEIGANPIACARAHGVWCKNGISQQTLDLQEEAELPECATCGLLGWGMEGGDPEVCAESDAGFDCSHSVTYAQAEHTCAVVGGRLCTATELVLGEGEGTGCGHNSRMLWSSSTKLMSAPQMPGHLKCLSTQRILVAGTAAAATPPVCVASTAVHGPYGLPGIAVRCCADIECKDKRGVAADMPSEPCKTCDQLGWPMEGGDPEVCSESDDGFVCTSDVDYAHAAALCNSIGTR